MTEVELPTIAGANRLIVVVGPSGAGKDSVLRAWRVQQGGGSPAFAQRVITRAPDEAEAHESVSSGDFNDLRARGAFATWWQAHGLDYGVRRPQFEPLANGRWVVLNGSRAHLPALRRQAQGLRVVEITAPPSVLARRLTTRGREDDSGRARRLSRAIESPVDADLTLMNDGELYRCVNELASWWRSLQGT